MSAAHDKQTTNDLRIAELKDAIQRGKLVFITGTGVSRQVAKPFILDGCEIVTWPGLLLHGIRRCVSLKLITAKRAAELRTRVKWDHVEEMVQVAEIVTKALHGKSPATYQHWLADTVGKLEVGKPRLIDALVALGGIAGTLCYDSLLEKRTKRTPVTWTNEYNVSAVINGREIEAAGNLVAGVLHLHGHWQEPASVVFGSKSYEAVLASGHAKAVNQVFVMGHTMLLVGCGGTLRDPNFAQFMATATPLLSISGNPHFILCRESEVNALRKQLPPWLHPIAYGRKYEDLAEFVESLAKTGGQPPLVPTPPPPAPAPGGSSDFGAEWNLVTNTHQPALMKDLLLSHRGPATSALDRISNATSDELGLQTRFPREVISFIAAYLADKAIMDATVVQQWTIVRDRESWLRVAGTRDGRRVLVAHPNLQFEANRGEFTQLARSGGHAVVFPTLAKRTDDDAVVPLPEPTRHEVAEILKKHAVPEIEADSLATRSNGNLPLLLRYLTGTPERPAWAAEDKAAALRPLALLGGWRTDLPGDIEAVSGLIGRDYHEWVSTLFPVLNGAEPPFVHSVNVFRPVSRYENWQLLGGYLADDDLARFQATATKVLQASDAKFDLEEDQRAFSAIHGKRPEYSDTLREGLAATLALMGAEREALTHCHPHQVRNTVYSVVHDVLAGADWKRWASLGSMLSSFAEADPDAYLKIIEQDLRDPETCQLKHLFTETRGGVFGGFYHAGLLWSLEVLAWNPDYLSRVALVLAALAKFKLPGNIANNPLSVLRSIFLSWMPQTIASIEQRKVAVQNVVRADPAAGWQLLLSLLPEGHSSTSPNQRPLWRRWIPRDWRAGGAPGERGQQEEIYGDLALAAAGTDAGRMKELLEHLPYLPVRAFHAMVARIRDLESETWTEAERAPVWEELGRLVSRHRRFTKTDWAMPPDIVDLLAVLVTELEPVQPEVRYQRLFNSQNFDLYESEDYTENDRLIAGRRDAALKEIREKVGIEGIITFAHAVKFPWDVGLALGRIGDTATDRALLPSFVDSADGVMVDLVRGYVWARHHVAGMDWLDGLNLSDWSPARIGMFFALVPFGRDVWTRAEKLLGPAPSEYWHRIQVRPRGTETEITEAVEKLIAFGRGVSAIHGLNTLLYQKSKFAPALGLRAVDAYLRSPELRGQGDHFELDEVVKYLQEHPETDQEALARLEWSLLPILDRLHDRAPVALEKSLARQPAFFAELLSFSYRRKGTPKRAEPLDEKAKETATRAVRLLRGWRTVPGSTAGEFDPAAFRSWVAEAQKLCEASGRWEVAQAYIGHVLAYGPKDPDGFWLHRAAAEVLDAKGNGGMIGGLVSEYFSQRGVYSPSGGKAEGELAARYEKMGQEADTAGFPQLAAGMRGLADTYRREAERQVHDDDG